MKDLLETIISHLPGNIYWKNREGIYLGCNERLANIAGFHSIGEFVGKTIYDLLPDHVDAAKIVTEEDEKIMASGQEKTLEEQGWNEVGEDATYLTTKVPLHDESGNVAGLVGLSVDITKLKKAERLKDQFIQNMEHDIRTPVSALYSVIKLVEARETDPEQKEMLKMGVLAAEELLGYANHILNFGKLESERKELLHEKFDPKKIIEIVFNQEYEKAMVKNLKMNLAVDHNIPPALMGDPERLKTVLTNLINNAVKFTQEGFVSVQAKLAQQNEKEAVLSFFVQDSGMGIPKDKQSDIYEKFMRGTRSNQGIHKGLGLGLWVAKRFIEEMGGNIEFQTESDKGTTFSCTLPFQLLRESIQTT